MATSSPIPLGEQVGPVTVGSVEQTDRVWICLDEPCNHLMDQLESAQGSLVRLHSSEVAVGLLAAAIFSEDGALYRAEVLKILPCEEEVEVRYVDYGNTEKVRRDSLFKLPSNLEAAAKLAVAVELEGVDARVVGNSEKNRAKIAKKLGKEGLMVELKEVGGTLVATFFTEGKKIKFSKSSASSAPTTEEKGAKEVETGSKKSKIEDKAENQVKSVKLLKSGEITMVKQLPALALLENVEITGQVESVSPIGSVWFSPKWIHDDLEKLSVELDRLDEEKKLEVVRQADICPGMLAAVRHSQYETLFRARVQEVVGAEVRVKYIDYGDGEAVPLTSLYYFPPGLDMIAPGVAEIVLARPPPLAEPQRVLTEILVSDQLLIMKLEMEESGAKVGRFYREGKEVTWDSLVETRSVYDKEKVAASEAAEDDVVLESEKVLDPKLNGKNDAAVPEVREPEKVEKVVQPEPSQSPEKVKPAELFKMVGPRPLEPDQEVAVFMTHVESVDRVWVSRLEEEEALLALMDELAELQEGLTKATRKKAGAVFAAVFSGDGELYRVALKEKAGPGEVTVLYMDFGNSEVIPVEALLNIPGHIAALPSYSIPVHFWSGLEDSPENQERVRKTLEEDNLTVTMVEGRGHFKIAGKEVLGSQASQALPQLSEGEQDQSQDQVESQEEEEEKKEEVPAEAVKVPKKDDPKPEKIEEEVALAPSVVRDLVKKFSEKLPSEGEVVSGGKMAVAAAGDIAGRHLVQQESLSAHSRPLENGLTVGEGESQAWEAGDSVVARFPGGQWQPGVVLECSQAGVLVSTSLGGGSSALVAHSDVKSSSLPSDALNLLERDINRNVPRAGKEGPPSVIPGQKEKINNNTWSGGKKVALSLSHSGQQPLPVSSELAKYSSTSSGSRHLQAVIARGNLETNSNISCLRLMTGPVSTYVLQNLITALPSPLLEPLLAEVLENFLQLCLDSAGSRLVQVLLAQSSQAQHLQILQLLARPEVLVSLATSPSGTFVAQACLPHITAHQEGLESLERLVLALLGHISHIAPSQAGSFFLQKLVGSLASLSPVSPALQLLRDEIIQELDQLVNNEPGSRVVQQTLLHCQDMQPVLSVLRWLEENIQEVVQVKPAVHLALVVLQSLAAQAANNRAWAARLERFVLTFIKTEDLMVTAALHPVGYLLAKEVVSQLEVVSEVTRREGMQCLARSVDILRASKTGVSVLKALE